MRGIFLAAFLAILPVCHVAVAQDHVEAAQQDRDGTSKEKAIIISARNESDGVDAEYEWVESNLPGANVESTSLVLGDPAFDVFEVTLPSGGTRRIYFDISSFFGKR